MSTRLVIVATILALAAVGGVAALVAPRGELDVAIEKPVTASREEISAVVAAGGAYVDDVLKAYARLAFAAPELLDRVPGFPSPEATSLDDIVKWKGKLSITTKKIVDVDIGFDGNALIRAIYQTLGFSRTYLVISAYSPCDRDASCRNAIVRLWPYDRHGKSLRGSTDDVARQLAVYLVRTSLKRDTDSASNSRSQPPRVLEFTSEYTSLQDTALAFDIIAKGVTHPECVSARALDDTQRLEACSRRALGLLEEARRLDSTNPHAHFGLGLLLLRQALDSAANAGRVVTVTALLSQAGLSLENAIEHSKVLADRIARNDGIGEFRLVTSATLQTLTPDILRSVMQYTRGWRAYVEAAYRRQRTAMAGLRLPAELQPYAELMTLSAGLYLGDVDVPVALARLDGLRRSRRGDGVFAMAYATQACRHGVPREEVDGAFRDALQDTDPVIRQSARIWRSICAWERGQRDRALADIAAVSLAVDDERARAGENATKEREVRTALVDLGYFHAIAGRFEEATRRFIAVAKYPEIVTRARCDPALEKWRRDSAYQQFLDEVARRNSGERSGVTCE